jgi:hypothetical protein
MMMKELRKTGNNSKQKTISKPLPSLDGGIIKLKMLIIDKIREVFEKGEWQYKFDWPDGNRYGDKYETIKSLSEKIGHPKTSLYLSIHQLVKEEFITFQQGLISYERVIGISSKKLNSEQNVHGGVATMPNSSNEADKQIKQNPFGG